MKFKIFRVFLFTLIVFSKSNGQCINGSSTNPESPFDSIFLKWASVQGIPGGPFSHNPFINTFNWQDPYSPIFIEQGAGFNIGGVSWINGQYPMLNPFNTGVPNSSAYNLEFNKPSVSDRDFKWVDGWELLWLNTGRTPDGEELFNKIGGSPLQNPQSAAPVNIPYIVLYNRYRGIVRIFANVWYDAVGHRYDNVSVVFRFDEGPVNGMLRHVSSYDTPLDQPTNYKFMQGPASHPVNSDEWLMADFQVGFDPCICTRNEAKLVFEFIATDTVTLQMISRSISIDKQLNNLDFLKEDFLNIGDINNKENKGAKIYTEMAAMVEAYQRATIQYEAELNDFYSFDNTIKRSFLNVVKSGLGSVGGIVGSGVAGSIISDKPLRDFVLRMKPKVSIWSDDLINLDTNDANAFASSVVSGTKGAIASGFDFLNTIIEVPHEPVKPSAPTATLTETYYSGGLSDIIRSKTRSLLVPGAIPNGYNGGNPGIDRLNYPAYNEMLGLFALLKTPKVDVKKRVLGGTLLSYLVGEQTTHANTKCTNNYCIKLAEPLLYRFNHAVKINEQKTKLYYSWRITFKRKKLIMYDANNNPWDYTNRLTSEDVATNSQSYEAFKLNKTQYTISTTPFYEIKGALNEPQCFTLEYLFGFILDEDPEYPSSSKVFENSIRKMDADNIAKIELKLMADIYFEDKGSLGQEINTVQVFTYSLYSYESGDNQLPESNSSIGNVNFFGITPQMIKHPIGTTIINNIQLNPSTVTSFPYHRIGPGNELHILCDKLVIEGDVTSAPGYKVYLDFLRSATIKDESTVESEVIINPITGQEIYHNPLILEANEPNVSSFCNGKNTDDYRSNEALTNKTTGHSSEGYWVSTLSNRLKMFPNPTRLYTLLEFNDHSSTHDVIITDVFGNVVRLYKSFEKELLLIDTHEMESGLYFITCKNVQGVLITAKLIIN